MKKQALTRLEKRLAKLEKENSKLYRENAKLNARLSAEDALWTTELGQNRHSSGQQARLLHIHETLESIISSDKMLRMLTRNPKEIFDDTLRDLLDIIIKSGDMPHFRDDAGRKEDSGNQCKLYARHFLLMTQTRKAHNWTQEAMGAFFGIDQSTVSRYLDLATKYDNELYAVTPENITGYIATIKSKEEFKEIVPGRDGGEITVDGTLVETVRPKSSIQQKKQYSGKSKRFAISTAMLINKDNYIIGISDSREGSCHDITVLTQALPDFDKWLERMINGKRIPDSQRILLYADLGYVGLSDYLHGIKARLPHKKPKGGSLTKTQKAQNKSQSKRRISVEHVFAHVKNWKRMSGVYEGTAEQFNVEFNGICGMYNKRKMWQDGTYNRWKKKIQDRI